MEGKRHGGCRGVNEQQCVQRLCARDMQMEVYAGLAGAGQHVGSGDQGQVIWPWPSQAPHTPSGAFDASLPRPSAIFPILCSTTFLSS